MAFPAYVGPLHPHLLFEVAGYFVGFRLYLAARRRAGDALGDATRWWVIAAAIGGAWLGGLVVYWAADPALTAAHWRDPAYLWGGKTIVGALAGGLWAVEATKRALGITRATGDLFAVPLAVGIAIGRIGCFLTGLSDRTQGLPTSLPWGVDFGDGVPRHPAPLYEAGFLLVLAAWLAWRGGRPHTEGALFRGFLLAYMAFRLGADFLKPGVPLAGLTAIQWTCVAVWLHYGIGSWLARRGTSAA